MRHVFSMETDRDRDLQTLAETLVSCQLKRKSGSCRDGDCRFCQTAEELETCFQELPACDRLQVKQLAQELYGLREFQYGLDEPDLKEKLLDWGGAVLTGMGVLVGCGLIAVLFFIVCFASLYVLGL